MGWAGDGRTDKPTENHGRVRVSDGKDGWKYVQDIRKRGHQPYYDPSLPIEPWHSIIDLLVVCPTVEVSGNIRPPGVAYLKYAII